MIKITITTVTMVFHHLPLPRRGLKSKSEYFHCISSKAVDTFSDRSGMCIEHSTLIVTQVPPWAAVSMSNAILFWITAFFIWICSPLMVSRPLELSLQSSFQLSLTVLVDYRSSCWYLAVMALVLSKRACSVKLVKASTLTMIFVVPTEGTNKAARQSYHWNTDHVHLVCK